MAELTAGDLARAAELVELHEDGIDLNGVVLLDTDGRLLI